MSEPNGPPDDSDQDPNLYFRLIARTSLLAISFALLFPGALDGLTHGAWPRLMASLGSWRWLAWGLCFVAMAMMRFAGGPRRGE
jgi:hypothetical protein